MAFGKWIGNLKGLFNDGPMKELAEEVAEKPQLKLSAENVVFSNEFNQTFNVESPVRENMRNSFLFSMLVMASHIVIADGKVEPSEYKFLGNFLKEHFGVTPAAGQAMRGNFYKCGDLSAHVHYCMFKPYNTPKPDYHRPEQFASLAMV